MARKIREGFVLYSDIIMNHMQYLTDAEFKTIIVEAMKASDAIANREPEPEPPPLSGPAWGCYLSILRTIRASQREYDKTALKNKLSRNKKKPQNLLPMSNEQLLSLGYTVYDIASLRECTPEEIMSVTNCDNSSPGVSNRMENAGEMKEVEEETKHEPELELEKDPDYGFDGCDKLYAALERQGIKITPTIKSHLRKLRYSNFTEEIMQKVCDLAFLDELRRLK